MGSTQQVSSAEVPTPGTPTSTATSRREEIATNTTKPETTARTTLPCVLHVRSHVVSLIFGSAVKISSPSSREEDRKGRLVEFVLLGRADKDGSACTHSAMPGHD